MHVGFPATKAGTRPRDHEEVCTEPWERRKYVPLSARTRNRTSCAAIAGASVGVEVGVEVEVGVLRECRYLEDGWRRNVGLPRGGQVLK